MRQLIRELATVENPYACPHGRPIIVQVDLGDRKEVWPELMAVATVTTGRKSDELQVQEAQRLAAGWGLLYVPREGRSLEQVRAEAAALGASSPAVIVVQPDGLCLHVGEIRFRYHPGMGLSRIRRLARGERDWMLWAMDLREGDQVLDATMGWPATSWSLPTRWASAAGRSGWSRSF